jgi:hypothetical protein
MTTAENAAAQQQVTALLRSIAADAIAQASISAVIASAELIAASAVGPFPPLRHRRGRAVSRAAKRRRKRAWTRRYARAFGHLSAHLAWTAVAVATGAVGASVTDATKEAA